MKYLSLLLCGSLGLTACGQGEPGQALNAMAGQALAVAASAVPQSPTPTPDNKAADPKNANSQLPLPEGAQVKPVAQVGLQELMLEPMPEHTQLAHGGPVIRNAEVYMRTASKAKAGDWVTGAALPLKKGRYRVEYRLGAEGLVPEQEAAALKVTWQANAQAQQVELSSRTLFGEDLAATAQSFVVEFSVPREGQVVLGLHYAGQGTLKLYRRILKSLDTQGDLSQAAAGLTPVSIQLDDPYAQIADGQPSGPLTSIS